MPSLKIPKGYDFGGYVTRYETPCTDGRTIKNNAFAHQDGQELPLVWGHDHNNPSNVIGKILLKSLPDGMYGFGSLNHTSRAEDARELLAHGDIKAMSIFANHLKEQAKQIMDGLIREVSLVLVGANPGAYIDNLVIQHGDEEVILESEAIICFTEDNDFITHADQEFDETDLNTDQNGNDPDSTVEIEHADDESLESLPPVLTEEEYNSIMADLDEIGDMLDSFEQEVKGKKIRHDAFEDEELALIHYASPYYDPVYAHEYYMAHRKLKGRGTSGVDTSKLNKRGLQKAKEEKRRIDLFSDKDIRNNREQTKNALKSIKKLSIADRKAKRERTKNDIKHSCSEAKNNISAMRDHYNALLKNETDPDKKAELKRQKLSEIVKLRAARESAIGNLISAYAADSKRITENTKSKSDEKKASFDQFKADKIIEAENDYAHVVSDLSQIRAYTAEYAPSGRKFDTKDVDDTTEYYRGKNYTFDLNNRTGYTNTYSVKNGRLNIDGKAIPYEEEKNRISHSDSKTIGDIISTFNEKQENVFYYLINEMLNSDEVSHSDIEAIDSIIENQNGSSLNHSDEETVSDVLKSFNKEQKDVLVYLMAKALEEKTNNTVKHSDEGGNNIMYNNIFENEENANNNATLSHADIRAICDEAKSNKQSLRDTFLAHSQDYGIENIGYLFPDAQLVNKKIEMIRNNPSDWVAKVMNGVHKSPFSRIKSLQADITGEDARARGYIKGNKKVEEVISLLKRTTQPQTVYKLQKLDRDDIVDITDIDVIAWLKAEMRIMLEEEIARAILFGDGRSALSADKIKPDCIRPILTDYDNDLFAVRHVYTVPDGADPYLTFIDQCVVAAIKYEGTGSPVLFTSPEQAASMQLVRDTLGNRLYKTRSELADACGVSAIVEVPYAKGQTFEDADEDTCDLKGIIVNLTDYTVGADKGGAVNLFDDFDLDYNRYQYLMETRFSGALNKPHSALIIGTKQD